MGKFRNLGQAKETSASLDCVNGPKKLVYQVRGKSIFQFRQPVFQFLELFAHFHQEILKDFVFWIHRRVMGI